jgi:hypothetical protein
VNTLEVEFSVVHASIYNRRFCEETLIYEEPNRSILIEAESGIVVTEVLRSNGISGTAFYK